MKERTVAILILLIGLGLIFWSLDLIPPPDDGTTTTTTQTTATIPTTTYTQGTLVVEAVKLDGSRLTNAGIKVDGRVVSNNGYASLTVESGVHEVEFLPVPGYVTPPKQTVLVAVGETRTVRGVYIEDLLPTVKLTVTVLDCSIVFRTCWPEQGATVVVDDLHRTTTNAQGKAEFRVEPGQHKIFVDSVLGDAERRVTIWQDHTEEFRFYTTGAAITDVLTPDLTAVLVFVAIAAMAYFMMATRRR